VEKERPRVLLIGESPRGSTYLGRRLEQQGGSCQFATSYPEACRILHGEDFDIVLSQMRLRNQSLYPLIGQLRGTRSTLFYWQPVENGCWWLPALLHGRECFGSSALRPGEFMEQLEGLIEELRFEWEEDIREKRQHFPVPASRGAEVPRLQSRREPVEVSVAGEADLLSHKKAS
jgi:hypothetical protein